MLEDLNQSLEVYEQKWQKVLNGRSNKVFFAGLKPTAVGWKVADHAEYNRRLAELQDQADHILERWMNGRWIAKIHLKDAKLTGNIEIIKLMERRPGSTDAIELDHVDFSTSAGLAENEAVLQAEPDLKWSKESNDASANYEWLSLWFDGTEAKIKTGTVLDIVVADLQALSERISKS